MKVKKWLSSFLVDVKDIGFLVNAIDGFLEDVNENGFLVDVKWFSCGYQRRRFSCGCQERQFYCGC